MLEFNKISIQMLAQLVYCMSFWLNVFPPTPGVSNSTPGISNSTLGVSNSLLFYSLNTERLLWRNHWTPLPMPTEVTTHIHALAKIASTELTFTDLHNQLIEDLDYEEDDVSIAGVNDNAGNDNNGPIDQDDVPPLMYKDNDNAGEEDNEVNNGEFVVQDNIQHEDAPEAVNEKCSG